MFFLFKVTCLLSGEVGLNLTGFESTCLTGVSQLDRPVTYCLEGSCSIQLSYETDIFSDRSFLSETNVFYSKLLAFSG